jgi:mannose-1-phosphate guanylyltransferase
VDYLEEFSPLGTMGPVVQLADRLPEHVLVMNGDILTDLPYDELLHRHAAGDAVLSIATYPREVFVDFGVLDVVENSVVGFREKPREQVRVSMGVYAVTTSALARYPAGRPFGFDDLVLDLLDRGTPPASYPFEGFWLDIGRPDDYDRANAEFAQLRRVLLPSRQPRTAVAGA